MRRAGKEERASIERALAGVIFAGAFHHLLTAGICYAMCRAAVAESARNNR